MNEDDVKRRFIVYTVPVGRGCRAIEVAVLNGEEVQPEDLPEIRARLLSTGLCGGGLIMMPEDERSDQSPIIARILLPADMPFPSYILLNWGKMHFAEHVERALRGYSGRRCQPAQACTSTQSPAAAIDDTPAEKRIRVFVPCRCPEVGDPRRVSTRVDRSTRGEPYFVGQTTRKASQGLGMKIRL